MSNKSVQRELVCGLEIHAELKTASKMFCGCKNDPFHAPDPNCYTCPVCLGMPGGLPVANKTAIEWTIKLGLALGCSINLFSQFDRKHYFYPDLPKGYQISQYDLPFCYNGVVETSHGPVRIRRIHLEEDTGKLLHKTVDGEKVSLVDFNRSSVPLMEIVTEPDIHSPEQAKEYGKKIRQILRYLDVADCDMEQGGMRLEANISLKETDATDLPNYKVEVKNINSFRFLEQAIAFEIQRQGLELMEGRTPRQETRGWDSSNNVTYPQRTKEDAEDYRYFPDPDLPPLRFEQSYIDQLKASLPELPDTVIKRWEKEYQIEPRFSSILIEDQAIVQKLEEIFKTLSAQKQNANTFVSLLVNKKLGKDINADPDELIKLFTSATQVAAVDTSELETIIKAVIEENPTEVAAYKAGKEVLLNFFVGQIMRKLGKKVDMTVVKESIVKQLT